jgi:hypothetical protein
MRNKTTEKQQRFVTHRLHFPTRHEFSGANLVLSFLIFLASVSKLLTRAKLNENNNIFKRMYQPSLCA